MDRALKQRLVGATILIALAVIFLPMLLDGEGGNGQSTPRIAIPERPDVEFRTRRLPVGEQEEQREEQTDSGQQESDAPSDVAEDAILQPEPENVRQEPPAAEQQTPPGPATGGTAAESPVNAAEPEPSDPAALAGRGDIIVQIASFSGAENAARLGQQLRSLGYTPLIAAVSENNRVVHRVRIGPFPDRDIASAAIRSVADKINGIRPRIIGDQPEAPAPVPATSLARTGSWVVQVGSFNSEGNANGLRDRLRAAGHSAFVEVSDQSPRYKVKAGSEPSRKAAEQLLERIATAFGIRGIVVEQS